MAYHIDSEDSSQSPPEPPEFDNANNGLTRRDLVATASKAAWVTPMVALLQLNTRPANAQTCDPELPPELCPPGAS